jgi:hypothetical protein
MISMGVAVAQTACSDQFVCLNGPRFGAAVGAMVFGALLAIGIVVGSIGTARRRGAQRRGDWRLSLTGPGASFEAAF